MKELEFYKEYKGKYSFALLWCLDCLSCSLEGYDKKVNDEELKALVDLCYLVWIKSDNDISIPRISDEIVENLDKIMETNYDIYYFINNIMEY